MSVVIKGSESFDVMIASHIANCQTANIKFKNISFQCETIEDADGTVFVKTPSAQPERKKGKWLDNDRYGYLCSECGAYLEIDCGDAEMNFCPNCGADMRSRKLQYGDNDTLQGGLMSAT